MSATAAALIARARSPLAGALAGVFFASLACFLAIGAVLPVLPRYVHGPLSSGDVATGIVVGAFAVTAIVARPWAGRAADVRGRRLMVAGGALCMALGAALMFVDAGVPGAVVARLVVGVGEGTVFTAGAAWAVDLAPGSRRGQVIGLFGLSVWGGLSAGPALGEALNALGGYDAVWAFAVAMPLAGALVAWRQPPDVPAPRPSGERHPLIVPEAVRPGVALALVNAGYATLAGFVGLHLAQKGIAHGAVVFPAFAVSVVVTRLALGRVPDRLGPLRAAIIAALANATGLTMVALAWDWPAAIVGALVMGSGFALFYPALALWVVNRVGEQRRGAALGSFTAFFDAGFGLGAPIAGALAAIGSYELAFCVAATFALGAAVMTWGLREAPGPRGRC